MVASARVKRFAWPAAAGAAAALIAALALHGERPQSGLARFTPAGVMADWPQISEVAVDMGGAIRLFRRDGSGRWRINDDSVTVPPEVTERIETGLKLLRNSPPQRVFETSEIAGQPLGEFGLAPPRLTVIVRAIDGAGMTIAFGNANPLRLARYARIDERPGLLLLSSYVAEPWERLAELP